MRSLQHPSVLIVEDEPMIALETEETLLDLGYKVLSITDNGVDAVNIAKSDKPDVVLMDIRLKGEMDGIEAAGIIGSGLNIPVIFMTAHSEEEYLEEAKLTFPYGYLVKPVQEKELKVALKMTLYAAKAEQERRKTEQNLKKSEKEYKELVQAANSIIMKFDPEGRITFINSYAQDFFGFKESEILGRNIIGSILPDYDTSGRDMANMIKKILHNPSSFVSNVNENICKDARRVWISWANRGITDSDGNLVELLSIGNDITERKKAEEALEYHQSMLHSVLDSIQEPALLIDKQGRHLFGNKATLNSLNISPEAFVGTTPYDLLPQELADSWMKVLLEVIETGKAVTFEDKNVDVHRENTVYPFYDASGEIRGASILSFDITDRIKKEQELQTLWMAVEQSPSSIVITGKDGNIEYVNPGFCLNTGYCREEAIGRNPNILKSDRHEDSFYSEMWSVLSSGNVWKGEICNRRKNGELFWEQASISPVSNEQGEIEHYIAVKDDITQKKELEHLKEDVERIMRHDLKVPLNAMTGYPQLLLNTHLEERQEKMIRQIANAGNTMLKIIDTYFNMIKMEEGTYEFNPDPINLVEILATVTDDLGPHARTKNLTFQITVNQQPLLKNTVIIAGGVDELYYSIFSNLIKNAVEASPEDSRIIIDIVSGMDTVKINIKNRGVVPEKIRDRFFEKYATFGKRKGTGLGTYSAKLMTETQGGSISMQTSDEEGTTITLVLPGPH